MIDDLVNFAHSILLIKSANLLTCFCPCKNSRSEKNDSFNEQCLVFATFPAPILMNALALSSGCFHCLLRSANVFESNAVPICKQHSAADHIQYLATQRERRSSCDCPVVMSWLIVRTCTVFLRRVLRYSPQYSKESTTVLSLLYCTLNQKLYFTAAVRTLVTGFF